MTDLATHSLPLRMRGIWTTLTQNYRVAKAASELADATSADDQEAKHDAMVDAINAIYLTPSAHPADLRLKIEVMNAHDMAEGPWWCAQEALAMLAIDAERLLPYSREGAAA